MSQTNYVSELISGQSILYLSERDVLDLDVYDFKRALPLMVDVLRIHHAGHTRMPRSEYLGYNGRSAYDRMISLLGYVGNGREIAGAKLINSSTLNVRRNLPRASGILILCDTETQRIYCMISASHVSAVRTAAITGLAISLLRPPRVEKVALIGSGALAWVHVRMWSQIFPEPAAVFALFDINRSRAEALVKHCAALGVSAHVCSAAGEAIAGADIVVPATTAGAPWIKGEWLKPGSLYAAVSLLDAELDVFTQANQVVVDDLELCTQENRPLHVLQQRGRLRDLRVTTLGALVAGDAQIAVSGSDRIVFNPMGTVMTDLVLGASLFERARANGAGQVLPA
ncbi:MAG TPA: hypothetical protein VG274_10440 [Rhizomicrobium sp.]|jgi:ornithine cyclodeaminase|nr:hypothetical protein [Rhizomicrobium sp.]